ncbi:MAG: HNH endonuclease [Nitrososphaera sp.]|nr:HNH endonuclease [Nitrososphaera sp.]
MTNEDVQRVWEKAQYIDATNEQKGFRKDECGAWIRRGAYGDRNSQYGWEVDHIKPKTNGGTDALSNLRPLHWQNNAAKSDGRLACVLTSSGTTNVEKRAVSWI